MKKPVVISIVGARPQFVKLAPLARALAGRFRHIIIHTGQHYDDNMSQLFFRQLRLPKPGINLAIRGGTHGAMTGRMLSAIEKILMKKRSDFVIVYGDTNSTLAGALAAAKLSIPVGHVEAGMRSFVDDMPEEINRRLTDHVSQLLFCPTRASMTNLKKEGIRQTLINSGDLMYELLYDSHSKIKSNLTTLKKHDLSPGRFLLLTAHRAANVDSSENLKQLVELIESLTWPVLFPVHPRTLNRLKQHRLMSRLCKIDHLVISEPLGYLDTLSAATHAGAVLTDSGGLQKEALFMGTPVLTLRDETEWVETVGRGNRLVGLDTAKVLRALKRLPRVRKVSPMVNGQRPSRIITSSIKRFLRGR